MSSFPHWYVLPHYILYENLSYLPSQHIPFRPALKLFNSGLLSAAYYFGGAAQFAYWWGTTYPSPYRMITSDTTPSLNSMSTLPVYLGTAH